jgi:hypothetical protein
MPESTAAEDIWQANPLGKLRTYVVHLLQFQLGWTGLKNRLEGSTHLVRHQRPALVQQAAGVQKVVTKSSSEARV